VRVGDEPGGARNRRRIVAMLLTVALALDE
jgi:hypothetical protein